MPLPFVIECQRQLPDGTWRALRERHASNEDAIEAMNDHQQRNWDRVCMLPVGPQTPLGHHLEQLWLLLGEENA